MIAVILVVATVWMGFAALFVLALASASHREQPQPDPDLGFVARRKTYDFRAGSIQARRSHAELLLQ